MTALVNNFNNALIGLKKKIQANRFIRWWLGELSSMVPGWMRSSDLTIDHYVLLPLDQVSSNMRKPDLASPRAVAITLSAKQILRKVFTLPLATEENLRQVLEFQMEQHTPFPHSKVYFGYVVRARDFSSGQLTVELVVTPCAVVDPALKTLLTLGVEVRAVFSDELLAASTMLNLLPTSLSTAPSPWRHGVNPWLAVLVGLLALAVLVMPLAIKREAVVQLLPYVEKGRNAAEIVSGIRRALEVRVEQHNYLLQKRQASPPVIQVLEELTHVLPDDTWVSVFELKDKRLAIQGETGSSPRLVGLFEKSSIFRDASFSSALFKGQAPGTERYQLAIQLRPMASTDAAPATKAASAPAASTAASQPVAGRAP